MMDITCRHYQSCSSTPSGQLNILLKEYIWTAPPKGTLYAHLLFSRVVIVFYPIEWRGFDFAWLPCSILARGSFDHAVMVERLYMRVGWVSEVGVCRV